MQNKPQLSAEMEKRLKNCDGYQCDSCYGTGKDQKLAIDNGIDIDCQKCGGSGVTELAREVRNFLATALEEERERIKRCLMPVVDIECNHEEGSTPVEDNLGQYHIASGVCCKCGTSVLDWKQNEPQLSAEMEERFDELLKPLFVIGGGYFEHHSGVDNTKEVEAIKQFLATALEEQRNEMMKKVVELNKKWGAVPNDFRHWYQELVESLNGKE